MSQPIYVNERDAEYFSESRRLTGPNLFFADTGVVLEALGLAAENIDAHARWREHVLALVAELEWTQQMQPTPTVRAHQASTSLAFAAPVDQLFTATEINEWAWETASADIFPALTISNAVGDSPNDVGDYPRALARLRKLSLAERNPNVDALIDAACRAEVDYFLDDETLSVGSGAGSHSALLPDLESFKGLDWRGVSDIPVVLVTGSNGKTTTVRLIAAMLKAHGFVPGYASTEGVVIDDVQVVTGDYSGPAGARTVLRDKRVTAAVLESARGGMLRRGLATRRANVAVVTNLSADHFGEYGIDSIDDLAQAKLIVAHALVHDGVLVLNADDPALMSVSKHLWLKSAVFASDMHNKLLLEKRGEGGLTCGARNGKLWLSEGDTEYDLGAIANMPLTFNNAAIYNIANIAAAALAAFALGVLPATINRTLKVFGQLRSDNPGRLECWQINGVDVLIDYAHNPAGLSGLLDVAATKRQKKSRLGLLLGQAGNREDNDIAALAEIAARFKPDLVVLKDIAGFERGREAGEVAALLAQSLQANGVKPDQISIELDEFNAAKILFTWAHAGDIIVLPMHGIVARQAMRNYLDAAAPKEGLAQ